MPCCMRIILHNLQDVDRGRLLESDVYFDHIELVESPLKVLLITNK